MEERQEYGASISNCMAMRPSRRIAARRADRGAQYDMGVTLLHRLARREQNAAVSVGHVAAQSGWDRKVSAEDPSQLGIHRQFHCSLGFDYTVPSFASPDACVLHVS